MSAAQDWEWVPDEDEEERSSLIASFIRGATAKEAIGWEAESWQGEDDGWDGVSTRLPDDVPEGGFGGGDRRSISVTPVVGQYHGDNWMARVNCKDLGTMFFSRFPGDITAALELCRGCEVLEECRDDALANGDLYHGVVGGMTPSARRRAVNQRRRSA